VTHLRSKFSYFAEHPDIIRRDCKPMTSVPKMAWGKISVEPGIHCCPNLFLFLLPDQSFGIVNNMCVCVCVYIYIYTQYIHTYTHTHTHIWFHRPCIMNYRCYQIIQRVKLFTQIESGAKCWLDVYHWGAGLAVAGRIRDTGQKLWNLFKQEVVATPVASTFSSLSHSSRRSLAEI